MGNEFGHPEWVDFPRQGNNFSHHYCRRSWDLCDSRELRYQFLLNFDIAMNQLDDTYEILTAKHQYITLLHEKDKLIAFEKGDLLFIFNFHPYQSFEHYRIGTKWSSEHIIVLDSDESKFDGKDRLRYGHTNFFPIIKEKWMNRPNYIQLYIPSRTAIVLIAKENISRYEDENIHDNFN